MDQNEFTEYKKIFDADTFRAAVKSRLKQKGMSQKQLADMIGINPIMFSKYFQGKYTPRYENLLKISQILECQPGELYDPAFQNGNTNGLYHLQDKKLEKEREKYEPLIKYLESTGLKVCADFVNGCYVIYSQKDKRQERPCWIDDLLAEKLELVIKNTIVDWMHK